MGECKFSKIWLENTAFSAWVKPVKIMPAVCCTLCKEMLRLGILGIRGSQKKHNAAKKRPPVNPSSPCVTYSALTMSEPCKSHKHSPDIGWIYSNINSFTNISLD